MPEHASAATRPAAKTGQPELKRTLGGFQLFAVAFAFISVAVGVFATYGDVLRTSGPVGIWLWVVAGAGQTLVALVVAQFVARIALSGSSYQWASRLANPRIGWFFGWLTFWYLALADVTIANATASQAVMPLLGMQADEHTARVLTIVILALQALCAILSVRLFGMITSAAVAIELAIIVVLVAALLIVLSVTGSAETSNLVSRGIAATDPTYFAIGGGLMAGSVMGLSTLTGFESSANLAEEAKDPLRDVPRAIVWSVVAASVAGFVFLVVLTLSIPDIEAISNDPSPVAAIIASRLGPLWAHVLLAGIALALFGAGLVVMAACARQVFAMSRDRRFPASRVMSRVNRRTRTPVPATILIVAIGVVLMLALPGDALDELIVASTLMPALLYGGIVILYLGVRRRLEHREGGFSLGRWELPVGVAALVWVAVVVFVLVTPSHAFVPALIVVGIIVLGGVYLLWLLSTRRSVLDHQPGGGDAVKAIE